MASSNRDIKYWVGFSLIPGIGRVRLGQLESHFGNLEAAWKAEYDRYQTRDAPSRQRMAREVVESIVQKGMPEASVLGMLGVPDDELARDGQRVLMYYIGDASGGPLIGTGDWVVVVLDGSGEVVDRRLDIGD